MKKDIQKITTESYKFCSYYQVVFAAVSELFSIGKSEVVEWW